MGSIDQAIQTIRLALGAHFRNLTVASDRLSPRGHFRGGNSAVVRHGAVSLCGDERTGAGSGRLVAAGIVPVVLVRAILYDGKPIDLFATREVLVSMSQASQSQPQPQSGGQPADSPQAASQARTTRSRRGQNARLPGQELTIEETLRVMDVARELRDQRTTAEEMFRRDDVRIELRNKLVRTARLSGDHVTEAEIDAAIDHYFESLHTFQEPEGGVKRFLAHCWIWRGRIIAGAAALAGLVGSYWFLFS